ncbi:MAG: hypothetical protein M3540_01880 [Actinomycetota bacterium]|nr:hypothetical protein [Actinomycetota bacterium]
MAESIRLIDFDDAEVVTLETFPPLEILVVRGEKPYLNMSVALVPRVYIRQPEYWGIEVVGSTNGFVLPATAPYTVSLKLAGLVGTRGIEVVGATKTKTIDLTAADGPDLPEPPE